MTPLAMIILAIIASVVITSAAVVMIMTSKTEGKKITAATVWEKMRPAIMEVLIETVKIYQANQEGYNALVDYCVTYVKHEIDESPYLQDAEKDVITAEFIYSLIEPQLKKLWDETSMEKAESIEE